MNVKGILAICIFLAVILSLASPALAEQISVSVEPSGVKEFWGITDVEKGKEVCLKVTIKNTGNIALEGFYIKFWLKKPDGTETDAKWLPFSDVLQPGDSVNYKILTGTTADQVGTWTAYVELYTYDKEHLLDSDSKDFEVVEQVPQAEITITDVVGYTAAGSMLVAGLYLLRRYV